MGAIADKIGSGATPRGGKESYVNSGIALVRSMNVLDSRFDASGLARITRDQAHQLAHVQVQPGDVLVNITGASVARTCLAPPDLGPACVNQHVAIVRVKGSEADSRYVQAYLVSPEGKARLLALASAGATREALTKAMLEGFTVPMPPPSHQRAVGSFLGTLSALVNNSGRRARRLHDIALATYEQWFVRLLFPGHEDAVFVDSPIGRLPEGWRLGTVADLCSRIQAGGTPRRSEPDFWEDASVDWYKTGDLSDSVLIRSSEQISEPALAESTAREFGPETILVAIYGSPTVGRLGLVRRRSSANQAALGLVANPNVASTEYLWFVLKGLRAHLNRVAQGAAQQNVSKAKVATAPALLPSAELTRMFAEVAGPSWRLAHALELQADALTRMRSLLLPRLVSGVVDLSKLKIDDIEASVA